MGKGYDVKRKENVLGLSDRRQGQFACRGENTTGGDRYSDGYFWGIGKVQAILIPT